MSAPKLCRNGRARIAVAVGAIETASEAMRQAVVKMYSAAYGPSGPEIARHGDELFEAAKTCDAWANGMRKEIGL